MAARTIKPTGIHERRLIERTKQSHPYMRGTEIKKSINENKLKELTKEKARQRMAITFAKDEKSHHDAKRKFVDVSNELLKEKVRIQGKLLEAFDKYYGFNGEIKDIYIDSAEVFGRDLLERHKMNTEILNMLNKIGSSNPKDKEIILKKIKREIKSYYRMDFG